MKMTGIVNYEVEDVFNHFIKNAKRDFSDFNEDNPVGCKIEKDITTGGAKPIRCTVEITGYEKNGKYEITTSNEYSKCVSTYTFVGQKDGTTKLTISEKQTTQKFVQLATLYIQRFFARRAFKRTFKNIIEVLNNELRIHFENIDRSKKRRA
ncbi:DUF3284 domain-containing protein [uncultured Clostridium sp.]|uniref:DUF3284 domain-containing protein n=1 Tax=uncultured Clostridium sp. TaxID=59620 RepID=UPI0025E9C171|nr:DUF3284 domain-containing protein [uncultured Clostridium sp.]